MKFKCPKDNGHLIERLESAVKDDRIYHAYLFEGPAAVDKVDFARSFVKGILCPKNLGENCGDCSICNKIDSENHEDIFYIIRSEKSVKDEEIKRLQEKLAIKPVGRRNIAIISDSDSMTERAQNRILKTLEEPPGDTILILLCENMENLVPTVLSRCVKYRIEHIDDDQKDSNSSKVVEMILEGEPFYRIEEQLRDYYGDRDKAVCFLDDMEKVYIKLVTENQQKNRYDFDSVYDAIYSVEEARKKIKRGMSVSYALKGLILNLTV